MTGLVTIVTMVMTNWGTPFIPVTDKNVEIIKNYTQVPAERVRVGKVELVDVGTFVYQGSTNFVILSTKPIGYAQQTGTTKSEEITWNPAEQVGVATKLPDSKPVVAKPVVKKAEKSWFSRLFDW